MKEQLAEIGALHKIVEEANDVYYGDWVIAHEHRAQLLEVIKADREVLREIAETTCTALCCETAQNRLDI